ncbi:MAG: diguanylate cyclase [Magnetococcales bacterium]|nr:diguanylate cyclase [Magnetococcales bacterium]
MLSETDKKPKILVVDDEKVNIDVLVGLLKPHYKLVTAKSGDKALKRLEKLPLPDLILLDIMMADMDGYELCRQIKENVATRDIPIIFVTGKTLEQDEAKGFEDGAVDYITKPFSPTIVLARVKTHVDLKKKSDKLKSYAVLDGLTGIPNRRRFDTFLHQEWERSKRYGHVISLLLMDIDFFKRYNDHYGHAEGDECLKKMARIISQTMPRSIDLAARYGGEEFVCVMPETDSTGAKAAAQRALEIVRESKIPHAKSSVAKYVTISIGVASWVPTLDCQSLALIEAADKQLYRAKEKGRNQLCVEKNGFSSHG